jgi:hypothetical protein
MVLSAAGGSPQSNDASQHNRTGILSLTIKDKTVLYSASLSSPLRDRDVGRVQWGVVPSILGNTLCPGL